MKITTPLITAILAEIVMLSFGISAFWTTTFGIFVVLIGGLTQNKLLGEVNEKE